ncbi:MAG: class I SAM-dependent methyltransferase [Candidatus Acidulodesulfobacterium ferriphilum]|uniref:Class I SAM-dependent methyltransferase n=1 Tax=Candidatus Acidulodesulfobacterium ferriphilum TaxID=2597223 RepID=A0A519BBH0_9DELT|nr:MAG: class I SAM-dependent methyltransferase [Candidatus Acidulodesulfobacterium ferriphilum]
MHKFDPANHKRLNSEERYRIMPPELLIDEIEKTAEANLKSGEAVTIADVGCGSGFFSLSIMKRFQDKNILLFALDVSDEMLGIFNNNLRNEVGGKNFSKVKSFKCEESFLPLADNSVNILLLANVFHEIEDKSNYLQEIKRVLKNEGTFFLVDWKKEDLNPVMGPPAGERVSTEEAVDILKKANFKDIKSLPLYSASFTLVSRKGD